jgi:CheY-like chemotaxis protein
MARLVSPTPPPVKVLVADDDDDARWTIRVALEAQGYDVVETSDGDTTLGVLLDAAAIRGALPDVLLLDFVMPGTSGIGILRALRRAAAIPATVLMTGFPDRSIETFARNLGVTCVLFKPLDLDQLLAAVLEAACARSVPA